MKQANYFFYYTYVGLAVFAGFWGAFVYPHFDFMFLFHLDSHGMGDYTQINLLAQYRFLRAMELSFGVFALVFVREIFTDKKFNKLYILCMSAGTLARIVSLLKDGSPSGLMYFFLVYELLGIGIISVYSWKMIYKTKPLNHAS